MKRLYFFEDSWLVRFLETKKESWTDMHIDCDQKIEDRIKKAYSEFMWAQEFIIENEKRKVIGS